MWPLLVMGPMLVYCSLWRKYSQVSGCGMFGEWAWHVQLVGVASLHGVNMCLFVWELIVYAYCKLFPPPSPFSPSSPPSPYRWHAPKWHSCKGHLHNPLWSHCGDGHIVCHWTGSSHRVFAV